MINELPLLQMSQPTGSHASAIRPRTLHPRHFNPQQPDTFFSGVA
jgi:hypothetical protein